VVAVDGEMVRYDDLKATGRLVPGRPVRVTAADQGPMADAMNHIVRAGGKVVYPGHHGTLIGATLVTGEKTPPGILYTNPGPGSKSSTVSATADYQVMLPKGVSLSNTDSFEIFGRGKQGNSYTFRMGPKWSSKPSKGSNDDGDGSWGDDIVSGTTTMTIPAGQLPEVPLAAALPVLGLGIFALTRTRRHGRTNLS
jgi:hypothetical protein